MSTAPAACAARQASTRRCRLVVDRRHVDRGARPARRLRPPLKIPGAPHRPGGPGRGDDGGKDERDVGARRERRAKRGRVDGRARPRAASRRSCARVPSPDRCRRHRLRKVAAPWLCPWAGRPRMRATTSRASTSEEDRVEARHGSGIICGGDSHREPGRHHRARARSAFAGRHRRGGGHAQHAVAAAALRHSGEAGRRPPAQRAQIAPPRSRAGSAKASPWRS